MSDLLERLRAEAKTSAYGEVFRAGAELLTALEDLHELARLLAEQCTDRVDVTGDPRLLAAQAAIARARGAGL